MNTKYMEDYDAARKEARREVPESFVRDYEAAIARIERQDTAICAALKNITKARELYEVDGNVDMSSVWYHMACAYMTLTAILTAPPAADTPAHETADRRKLFEDAE